MCDKSVMVWHITMVRLNQNQRIFDLVSFYFLCSSWSFQLAVSCFAHLIIDVLLMLYFVADYSHFCVESIEHRAMSTLDWNTYAQQQHTKHHSKAFTQQHHTHRAIEKAQCRTFSALSTAWRQKSRTNHQIEPNKLIYEYTVSIFRPWHFLSLSISYSNTLCYPAKNKHSQIFSVTWTKAAHKHFVYCRCFFLTFSIVSD